jgi:hypothetical protein
MGNRPEGLMVHRKKKKKKKKKRHNPAEHQRFRHIKPIKLLLILLIFSRDGVTTYGVWIDDRIYWNL